MGKRGRRRRRRSNREKSFPIFEGGEGVVFDKDDVVAAVVFVFVLIVVGRGNIGSAVGAIFRKV